jgi:cyanate permease
MALSSWLPTYYEEVRGLDLSVAAYTAAVFAIAGIPAAIIGGTITSRTGRRRPILLGTGLLLGLGGLATIYAPIGIPLFVAVTMTGMIQWAYEPAIFTLPLELPNSTPERAGAITATMVSVGNGTSFIAPVLVGMLKDMTGSYGLGLSLISASAITLFIAALFLPETGPGRHRR